MYCVRVYDNFHYGDETEAFYLAESFETTEAAVTAAKAIVEESCAHHGYDYSQSTMFGDDPAVVAPAGAERVEFSAWTHAKQVCEAHRPPESPAVPESS